MPNTFKCSIVTPTKPVLDDEVTYVSFPAWDGQAGVMPKRSPMVSRLEIGSIRLEFPEGGERLFLLEGGFAQMGPDPKGGNRLTILTEHAIAAESLSEKETDAELAEANARVTREDEDQQQVERDQKRAMVKKQLIEAMRTRGHAI